MIAIVDYGLGNLRAFINVYDKLHIQVAAASNCDELKKASKLILPGVGSFDNAMQSLKTSGMMELLTEMVLDKGVPILGVCVGMQMLASSSEEGTLPGLGWIDGKVKKFRPGASERAVPVPHMGWNDVKPSRPNGIFEGLEHAARFYFLHSYYFDCHSSDHVVATSDYNGEFACAVNSGKIFGVQFHPEKSHNCGIRLLENFAKVI